MLKQVGTQTTLNCECIRCKGLVVLDYISYFSSIWLKELRCVNCGWVKVEDLK